MSFPLSEYTKIDVGWGFAPDPRALSSLPNWFQEGLFAAGGEWRGGEIRNRRRVRGKGRENGNGMGGERGEVGGIAPLLLGNRRP